MIPTITNITVFDSRDLCKWNHVREFLSVVDRKKETLVDTPKDFEINLAFLYDNLNKHLINLVGVDKYSLYLKEKQVAPPTSYYLEMLEYLQANKENIYAVTGARGLHGVLINLKDIVLKSVDVFLNSMVETIKKGKRNDNSK